MTRSGSNGSWVSPGYRSLVSRWVRARRSSLPLLGVAIAGQRVTIVELARHDQQYELLSLCLRHMDGSDGLHALSDREGTVLGTLQNLVMERGFRNRKVAVSLSGPFVRIKQVTIPFVPQGDVEIEEYLTWEYQQYADEMELGSFDWDFHQLPYPAQQLDSASGVPVLLVAARKDVVQERTNLFKTAGLTPMVVDVDSCALVNMYLLSSPEEREETTLLVNLESQAISLAVVSKGLGLYMKELSAAVVPYEDGVQHTRRSLDEAVPKFLFGEPANEREERIVKEWQFQTVRKIDETLGQFLGISPGTPVDHVKLFGEYARAWGLVEFLQSTVKLPVEIGNPLGAIRISASQADRQFLTSVSPLTAVAVGLATRAAGDR